MTLFTGRDTFSPVVLRMLDYENVMRPVAYRLGDFRLDTARRLLFRETEIIPLPERIFQILMLLIEAAGGVVHRDTIAAKVWPDTAVADGNIAQHVYLLRKILGEHARDRGLVMAVSRKGYRLTVPVTAETLAVGPMLKSDLQPRRCATAPTFYGWCGPVR